MIAAEKKICILDYGSGNVRSVFHMLQTLAPDVVISNKPEDMAAASHLVLPGVGAFGAAMEKIRERIPLEALRREVFDRRKPFLGICVGMQALAEKGFEFGEHAGLGWIPGSVVKMAVGALPLPHIGWNNITAARAHAVLQGLGSTQDFYFVHSYVFAPRDASHVVATAEYGQPFAAIVAKDNILGVQFHPEKSQKAGALLLKNFLNLSS